MACMAEHHVRAAHGFSAPAKIISFKRKRQEQCSEQSAHARRRAGQSVYSTWQCEAQPGHSLPGAPLVGNTVPARGRAWPEERNNNNKTARPRPPGANTGCWPAGVKGGGGAWPPEPKYGRKLKSPRRAVCRVTESSSSKVHRSRNTQHTKDTGADANSCGLPGGLQNPPRGER